MPREQSGDVLERSILPDRHYPDGHHVFHRGAHSGLAPSRSAHATEKDPASASRGFRLRGERRPARGTVTVSLRLTGILLGSKSTPRNARRGIETKVPQRDDPSHRREGLRDPEAREHLGPFGCPFTAARSPLSCPSEGFDGRMKVAPELSSFNWKQRAGAGPVATETEWPGSGVCLLPWPRRPPGTVMRGMLSPVSPC